MILRWLLFGLSLIFAGVASLTLVMAPTLLTWKVAILAGEFGHLLLFAPLIISAVAWAGSRRVVSFMTGATWVMAAAAIAGFLRPTFDAMRIATRLPERLSQAFGQTDSGAGGEALKLSRLIATARVPSVAIETMTYSGEGTSNALALDFFRPVRRAGSPAPCVVVIHGGGWDGGERTQLPHLNHRLAGLGFAVAAVDYRLAPKDVWPAQREDVLTAIAYLKQHATRLGIDRGRIVLLGRSAGGQLATAVGYTADDPAIRGVIALYSPHDLPFAWSYARTDDVLNSFLLMRQYFGGTPEEKRAAYDQASGYLHVSAQAPPTLLVHGTLDTLTWYKQSERLDAKLTEARVPHVYIALPWATHAFDFNPNGPGGQLAHYAIEYFLAAVVGGS